MDAVTAIITLFILSLLGTVLLGLVAGFSPTLYIAQAALSSRKKSARKYTYALMAGVFTATTVLLVLFQTFSLSVLTTAIQSTVQALTVSVIFNSSIGVLFVIAGAYYISSRNVHKVYDANTGAIKKAGGVSAFFGFGFAKTFLSVSSATAVFLAGNLIANTSTDSIVRTICTLAFLAASITPFWLILYYVKANPERVMRLVSTVKARIADLNYRLTTGIAAITFGLAILIYNGMMALLY